MSGLTEFPPSSVVRRWAADLSGQVVLPDDPRYDDLRRVWNRAIDRRPAAIVRCATRDDAIRTIEFARSHHLPLAVRSGGHSQAGLGVRDRGVVLDLADLRTVDVHVERRLARVGGGAHAGHVLEACNAYGLVTPMGGCPDVGVGGLTLGGGSNFLMAKYGMVCDNVLAVELITADGRLLRVSADEHPDLFWAIRGGGGNFGVAVSFEYQLFPIVEVLSGQFLFPIARAREVMHRYRDLMTDLPDELTTSGGLSATADHRAFFIAVCASADRTASERVLERWRTTLDPAEDNVKWAPYAGELVVDPAPSAGSGRFLPELSDDVIDVLAEAMADAPRIATAAWNDFHGAVTRVPVAATAFPLRRRGYDFFAHAAWQDDAGRAAARGWIDRLVSALEPFGAGAYVNNLNETEAARVPEAYGPNYARLAEIKARYDPDNVFDGNHNIPPATR